MTTVHCLLMRYIRDYPGRVHQTPDRLRKLGRLFLYVFWLAALPALAVAGWVTLLIERCVVQDFTFTMNLFLVARRRPAPSLEGV